MDKLVCIVGTNASGKSSLAVELALYYGADIVSADSRQVYEGLDLGSGKITVDEMKGVPHYMIDVAKPNDRFTLAYYQRQAYQIIDDLIEKGRTPFLVGGTGLYVNAVVDGYDMDCAGYDPALRLEVEKKTPEELIDIIRRHDEHVLLTIDLKNKRRLERAAEKALSSGTARPCNKKRYDCLLLGITWPRQELYERIRIRLDRRLSEGMIDEVARLRENGATDDFLYRLGLEYRYILMYLRGEFADYDAFYDKLFMEIRHLAKEQMTWFRKRSDIIWIDMANDPVEECKKLIDGFLGA